LHTAPFVSFNFFGKFSTKTIIYFIDGAAQYFKNPFLIADALYQWTKKNLTETSVFFSPKEYYDISTEVLQSRFASAKTAPGMQKYDSLISSSGLTLMLKKYSSSSQYDVFLKKLKRTKKSSMQ